MKSAAVKHANEASVEVDNVTATGSLHKIQQWARKACYNANTDSYTYFTPQRPRNAFVTPQTCFENLQTICPHIFYERNSLTGLCTNKTLKCDDLSHQASSETGVAIKAHSPIFTHIYAQFETHELHVIHKLST